MNTASLILNLTGMTLEFLSFWFVAPEILGQDRLERLEGWIERPLAYVNKNYTFYTLLSALIGGLLALLFSNYVLIEIGNFWIALIFMSGVGGVIGWLVIGTLDKVIPIILSKLSEDDQIRRRAIVIGAVMFIIGFFLQFISVILEGLSS